MYSASMEKSFASYNARFLIFGMERKNLLIREGIDIFYNNYFHEENKAYDESTSKNILDTLRGKKILK